MGYTRIMPIRSDSHLHKAFEYIINPDKTEEQVNVSSYLCDYNTAVEDFREIHRLAKKGGNTYAHHLIQAFSTEDNITPDKALEMGEELMKRMYPDHQYVIAVHTDTEHVHVHIIMNSVNFITHKKLRSNPDTLKKLQDISDDICRENEFIVIDKEFKDDRRRLKAAVDKAIEKSNSFTEFLAEMQNNNFIIKYGKHLMFKSDRCDRFYRVDTLGTEYSDYALHDRCRNHIKEQNKRIQPYMNKSIPSTQKNELKYIIDAALRRSTDFDGFLEYLRYNDIEVKQGKHLAVKLKTSKRFRRVEKLGEEYTEEMLRLYFTDREKYNEHKTEINKCFGKIISPAEKYGNRYIAVENINTIIKMMNFMKENNISSQEELFEKMDKEQHRIETIEKSLRQLYTQADMINTAIEVKNSHNTGKIEYEEWQEITEPYQKELYRLKNHRKIETYLRNKEIINHYKEVDERMIDFETLSERVSSIKKNIEQYQDRLKKSQSMLVQYEILYKNLKEISDDIEEEQETEEIEEPVKQRNYSYWER